MSSRNKAEWLMNHYRWEIWRQKISHYLRYDEAHGRRFHRLLNIKNVAWGGGKNCRESRGKNVGKAISPPQPEIDVGVKHVLINWLFIHAVAPKWITLWFITPSRRRKSSRNFLGFPRREISVIQPYSMTRALEISFSVAICWFHQTP